jgi:hypothetical protein
MDVARDMMALIEVYLETGAKPLIIVFSLLLGEPSYLVFIDTPIHCMLYLVNSFTNFSSGLGMISHTSFFMMD